MNTFKKNIVLVVIFGLCSLATQSYGFGTSLPKMENQPKMPTFGKLKIEQGLPMKSVVCVDANSDLWQRDRWKMGKGIGSVIWRNKALFAKIVACNPLSFPHDCYKAWRSDLYMLDGKKVYGLRGFLDYFSRTYNEPAIMDVEPEINEALAHIKADHTVTHELTMVQRRENADIYIVSSNDPESQELKMASYDKQLKGKNQLKPKFKGTFYITECPECMEYGKDSEECHAKIREFVGGRPADFFRKK